MDRVTGGVAAAARAAIRDVPDFPKAGIVFKDITPLLADAKLFAEVATALSAPFAGQGITHVVAIESRGFILGGPVALALNAGFAPVRKPGKLPRRAIREDYALEYGTDALEIHADALTADSRVLVVDDVLATGGTAAAAGRLVGRAGGQLVGFSFLIELAALGGRGKLPAGMAQALLVY